MTQKHHIEKEVARTLRQMEEEAPLKADPFFYTRLTARIQEEQAAHHLEAPTTWQRWRPFVLAALVGANIITAALWMNTTTATSEREQALNAMAQDYSLVTQSSDWLSESLGE